LHFPQATHLLREDRKNRDELLFMPTPSRVGVVVGPRRPSHPSMNTSSMDRYGLSPTAAPTCSRTGVSFGLFSHHKGRTRMRPSQANALLLTPVALAS
jgi:hypothetical protein